MSSLVEVQKLIVNDSGWKLNDVTSRPTRGLRDYFRKVEFSRVLTREEFQAFHNWLKDKGSNNFGQTGLSSTWNQGSKIVSWNYSVDSSD